MSYRVEYFWDRDLRPAPVRRGIRPVLFMLIFFGVFLVSVSAWWQQGREVLMQLLFPGDRGAVVAAFSDLTRQLDQGIPLLEAAESICNGLLHDIY